MREQLRVHVPEGYVLPQQWEARISDLLAAEADALRLLICGPPDCGKATLARIIASLYARAWVCVDLQACYDTPETVTREVFRQRVWRQLVDGLAEHLSLSTPGGALRRTLGDALEVDIFGHVNEIEATMIIVENADCILGAPWAFEVYLEMRDLVERQATSLRFAGHHARLSWIFTSALDAGILSAEIPPEYSPFNNLNPITVCDLSMLDMYALRDLVSRGLGDVDVAALHECVAGHAFLSRALLPLARGLSGIRSMGRRLQELLQRSSVAAAHLNGLARALEADPILMRAFRSYGKGLRALLGRAREADVKARYNLIRMGLLVQDAPDGWVVRNALYQGLRNGDFASDS